MNIPEGYKLVPAEPTAEMLDELTNGNHGQRIVMKLRWAQALAAAPVPPQADVQPVAYAVFSDSGNIRIWSTNCEAVGIKVMQEEGKQAVPLYTHPDTPEALQDRHEAWMGGVAQGKAEGRDIAVSAAVLGAQNLNSALQTIDTLRAQLAERDALLQRFIENSDDTDVVELSRHALATASPATINQQGEEE